MSLKLKALNSRLQMLKTQRDEKLDLHLLDNSPYIPPVTDPEPYTMPSVVSSSDVVGAKLPKDADFMVRLLTDHGGKGDLPVYAIVGPGGIGKTTMANLIFELLCDKKQGFFDRIIRITVPHKQDQRNFFYEVSDKLSPPEELENLRIIYYYGSTLPSWLSLAARLPNQRSLQLEGCLNLKVISGLGQLPCLEHLLLKQAPKVTSVGKHFLRKTLQGEEKESSSSSSSFPKLKVLHFEDMAEWEKWDWPKIESMSMEFPYLHTLNVSNCPKLKSIPEEFLCRLKMLRQLIIDESPQLRLEGFPSFLEIKIDSQVIQPDS